MGPTACGKSKLAICLRKYLPIELISVDSALIYRGMDIGTDKPSVSDLCNHPHRLLNIKDPIENYSAAEFQRDVLKEIDNIIKLDKIPCLVGGTMFYYNVLLHGLSVLPPSNIKIREFLLKNNNEKYFLHKRLEAIDPISASRIHKNDFQRLLRALEIFYISGKSLTEIKIKNNYKLPYNIFQFAIMPPNKEWLNNKIKLRVKKMLVLGFQKEVEILFLRGDLHINLPSIRCIGYRQMWEYLEYKNSYEEMFNKIIYATRKLAKHQLTWLKKWKNLNKILYNSIPNISVQKILNILQKK
ncbi:tRNA (adenosine(37)-N6)-dimethylallyltransferase MiaA [Buchnera aphidicola (Acyrthosiphon lactucae)]|uniref:tRNA dimethylallyltransferase n=1 Tax=Buchnera aphidicola (Acyrthosiphon lactucae) TaxID=1241832 RepID=A0A4D6XU71_9GAMM|nr:tRNA (adenosine(37)-N6)-dimethylallyltransferase MiaA [Buchnera aphidicola]QCI17940.1 tRNA (adenosine(37)-N6)-dimethylallyltransferase MiaA [Buchnera aphidicola (Acyrthosiphon lactucae)]